MSASDDTDELQKLRDHNTQLLAELKEARADLETLTTTSTAQASRLEQLEFTGPIDRAIEQVAVKPMRELFRLAFDRHFRFVRAESGIAIETLDGKPAMLPPVKGDRGREVERAARATPEDITALVSSEALAREFDVLVVGSRASGGQSDTPAGRGQTAQPKSALGLR